jgi:hypothetical protein
MLSVVKRRIAESEKKDEASSLTYKEPQAMPHNVPSSSSSSATYPSGDGAHQHHQQASLSHNDNCILSLALKTARDKGVKMDMETALAQVTAVDGGVSSVMCFCLTAELLSYLL